MKYAVLVKHAFRDNSDIRVEIVEVPNEREDFGPMEAKALIQKDLLGPFEVIAVTDRISVRDLTKEQK
jgi:hypothetical protein